ncbi:type II CRISPR RNA-guided endonuclease Cas9 [Filifactor alocis]
MTKEYYLGLDVGTNSVGWAVTDSQYNLCKFKKKDMWGIRLFESAKTAEKRRLQRGNRRRLERKKQRIDLLQEIFSPEISKIDPTFFIRLNESRLHLEDKSNDFKYPLFIEKDYSDIEYYKEFPTIFHLRKHLIESEEKQDIRLIYLALHNIIKTRGHFLIDGDLQSAKQIRPILDNFLLSLQEELNLSVSLFENQKDEFEEILKNRSIAKSEKVKKLKHLFEISDELEKQEKKAQGAVIENFCKFIVGNKGDVCKFLRVSKEELEIDSFSFSEGKYEGEIVKNLEEKDPEKIYLFEQMKAMYDWNILVDILGTDEYISFAKVKQYEKHKTNLRLLRDIILKYCSKDEYHRMFNDEKEAGSYSAYVGKLKKNNKKYWIEKNRNPEEFYKYLGKLLEKIEPSEEDSELLTLMIEECKNRTLLPIQRNKDNGVIPHQVHEVELKKILEHAIKHYPFLTETDKDGYSIVQKIESIFRFRIPYYVGPLSTRHQKEGSNTWIVRQTGREDRIYPWNIEEIVDFEKSNENFITRMTNKCTYLIGEDVLPKHSLLYSKYMVLNELNNVKVRGKKLPTSLKQKVFEDLFENKSKVTGKNLLEYLQIQDKELQIDDLSGFDKDFKTSLKSYLDFKKQIFGEEIEKESIQQMIEDIIKWITIYGNDKEMLKRVIRANYSNQLTEEQLKKITGFQYSGWGNFSKMFLRGIIGSDVSTGETFDIITAMWGTDNNLMQILSKKFTFMDYVEDFNSDKVGKIDKVTYDSTVKEMFLSPKNKRAVWQTIQVAEEIKKVMGCEPKKIFIEMARGGEKVKKRTKSRKAQLLELYAACESDYKEWEKEIESREERDFNSMKLFLYYTQMGRCMYTGKCIDLDELLHSNSKWDRDHIYPQSKIKDDSIDNLVLTDKKVNEEKEDKLLSEDIQKKMHSFWLSLLNKKLITKSKYDRLTRKGDFTDEELSGFIARQLVETRQSSKAIADLFKQIYSSEVVYVKSSLVSDFRKKPLKYLKSRRVNDYHHAKDAYLNIVVGNVYNKKFTSNPIQWMKKNRDTNYSLNKVFEHDVIVNGEVVWEKCTYHEDTKSYGGGTLDRIRKIVECDNILYTEYSYCEKGELFDENIKNKNGNATVSIKKGLDRKKYGGYFRANTSYFSLIEFEDKHGDRARHIIGVPIYIANMLEHSPSAFLEYCEQKGYQNIRILTEKIKKNSLLIIGGYPLRIRGEDEKNITFKRVIQLKLDQENYELVRNIEKFLEKYVEKKGNYPIDENRDHITHEKVNQLYEVLLSKMKKFNKKGMADPSDRIEKSKPKFIKLEDLIDKINVINKMLNLLRCDNDTKADLSLIELPPNAGVFSVKKNTIGKSKIVLVNQSVTGLYENRREL